MLMNHSLEFYYTSLFSTVLIYILFFSNLASLIPKIAIFFKYRKVNLRHNKAQLRNYLIHFIFNRKIYQMSLLCTIIEMFFHGLALITSAKYFIKSEKSYLVEMEANQLHSQRFVDLMTYRLSSLAPKVHLRIENPANVDLFLFKYSMLFLLKLVISYIRFRKIFLQKVDHDNPFDLEVFVFRAEEDTDTLKLKNTDARAGSEEAYLKLIREEPTCSICSRDYETGEKIANFECQNNHFFHLACINEWINRSPTCPMCRAGLFR